MGTPGTIAWDIGDITDPTADLASHQMKALAPFGSHCTVDHISPSVGTAGKSREVHEMIRSDVGLKCKLLPRFQNRNVTFSNAPVTTCIFLTITVLAPKQVKH